MDTNLAIIYLSVLLVLLAGGGIFLFRQIFRTRRTETRFSQLQAKLSKGKGSAEEYYELGSILLDKRLYTQSIEQFKKAMKAKDLDNDENRALLFNALGYAYAAQEQFDLAIRQYKDALELKNDYVVAWNNLGFAYEKKQLLMPAIEAYETTLKYEPNNSTAKRRSTSLRKRLPTSESESKSSSK